MPDSLADALAQASGPEEYWPANQPTIPPVETEDYLPADSPEVAN